MGDNVSAVFLQAGLEMTQLLADLLALNGSSNHPESEEKGGCSEIATLHAASA